MIEIESGPVDITDTVSLTKELQIYNDQEDDELFLANKLSDQYINLNNIGINYLEDIYVSDGVLQDIIEYVNDAYLPIMNIDVIFEAPNQIQLIGRFIYEFMCVDMKNNLLPNVMKLLNLHNSDELKTVSYDLIKEYLLRAVQLKMKNLQKILKETSIEDARYELLKFTYYIDLLDNNIEKLQDQYIIPMIDKYDMFFDSIN